MAPGTDRNAGHARGGGAMSRPSAVERLSRLLAIVPWVVAHDGPLVSEVCERFAISERELVADLNLLFLCGAYPYTPDALIEVDFDGGRVWVRFADWFRRPVRLSPPEALALVAAARAMLEVPAAISGLPGMGGTPARPAAGAAMDREGRAADQESTTSDREGRGADQERITAGREGTTAGREGTTAGREGTTAGREGTALARAVAKLEMILGAGADDALDIELGAASAETLATLQAGAAGGRKVAMDYYSFGRDQSGRRVVHPWRVFSSEGHWYLSAWCEQAAGKRLFRVDRARDAVLLDEHFEPPSDVGDLSTYERSTQDPLIVLDLAPGARWVADRYPHEGVAELAEGHIRVELRASSAAWLERLLLRAGPDARVVSGAPGAAQAAARRVLAVYQPG